MQSESPVPFDDGADRSGKVAVNADARARSCTSTDWN